MGDGVLINPVTKERIALRSVSPGAQAEIRANGTAAGRPARPCPERTSVGDLPARPLLQHQPTPETDSRPRTLDP